MSTLMAKKISPRFLVWVAVVAFSGLAALAQNGATARTDGQIEMDVVHALDGAPALKNDLITAATVNGEVTLAGTVSSVSSRELAVSIVQGVAGVKTVHNNLQVGNPADDPNAQVADDQQDDMPVSSTQQQPQTAQQPQPYTPVQQGGAAQQQSAQNYPQQSQNGAQAQAPDWGPAGPPPDYDPSQDQASAQQAQPQQQTQQGNARPNYPSQNAPYESQQYPNQAQNAPYPNQNQGAPYQPYNGQPQPAGGGTYNRGPRLKVAQGPLTVPAGSLISVRTAEAVSSKHASEGAPVVFTVIQDVVLGGYLAIPRGATVHGVVAQAKQSGQLTGSSELALQLISLEMEGQSYPIQSDLFRVQSPSKTGRTVGNTIGGALIGAIIGGAAGGGGGAAIGAVAGGTVGTAASAASRGPDAWIPAEALVTFHLIAPVTVNPVSPQEASRLAQGLYQGGPSLYQRGYGAPPPQPRYYATPGYYGPGYYPPVYYRPYFVVGGSYYWR
ncbi:MAG TPA: BON domain-containing protein [Terracidiphilus sp.]